MTAHDRPARSPPMLNPDHVYTALDVETTGLDPSRDSIIEIALVALDRNGREVAAFDTLLRPGSTTHAMAGGVGDGSNGAMAPPAPQVGATNIHGLTGEMLAGAPTFEAVAPWVGVLLEGTVAVAHYAKFDMSFINAEFDRAGLPLPAIASICTIEAARAGGVRGPYGMQHVAQALGIIGGDIHHALADTRTCAAILRRLLLRGRVDAAALTRVRHARPSGGRWPSAGPATSPALLPRAIAAVSALDQAV